MEIILYQSDGEEYAALRHFKWIEVKLSKNPS
jgi:hypothetical protein